MGRVSKTQVVKFIRKGTKGDLGATLRGPQAWSDCATGYAFQAGKAGDTWKDVVLYGGEYYSCVRSHTKAANNYPGSSVDQTQHYWKLGDRIELVATRILMTTYALVKNLGVETIEMKDSNGAVKFLAKGGTVQCETGIFNNIDVQSGKIAGFQVSGTGLSNGPDFNNDAYVIFRNDYHKAFAGIGGNVLPASSGMRAVARFENEDTTDQWGIGSNIAMLLSAKNGGNNFAFLGDGNGVLDGWIGGRRYNRYVVSTANTIFRGYCKMKENNTWVVYSNVSNSGITLPDLYEVRDALGIGSSEAFSVEFKVVADIDSSAFFIYGRNNKQDGSGAQPWNTDNLPLMITWQSKIWGDLTMEAGDSITFLLVYDPNKYGTKDGYTIKYTARILNRQN